MKIKMILLTCLFIFNSNTSFAQNTEYIGQIEIVPSNPTTADSIKVYVHGSFPASNYLINNSTIFFSDTTFQITLEICYLSWTIGAAVITPFTRSFSIGELTAGNYLIQSHSVVPTNCQPPFPTTVSDSIDISFIVQPFTHISDKIVENLPSKFRLFQNYPNPFNPKTAIGYQLSSNNHVVLKIFNMLGQEVKTLVNAQQSTGRYNYTWNGLSETGKQVASGVYYYQLFTEKGISQTKKLILLR